METEDVYMEIYEYVPKMKCSRRSALRWIGTAAGLTATAGCLDFFSSGDYTLVAQHIKTGSMGELFLVSDPVSVTAATRVDFATETKQQYVDELFETGRVTVREWPLVARDTWGTDTRPRPTFIHHDGTYYEVQVTDQRYVEQERWLFAFERTDSNPPDDATVITDPFTSLSAQDRQIVKAALDAIHAGHDGFLGEPEFDGLQAVEYHQDLSANESGLVPSPPFDFVQYENEFFNPVTDQRIVAVPEWTYTIESVADSADELEAYATETVPDVRLNGTLSDGAREILDTTVTEKRYEEENSLSDGLSEVLTELGIAGDLEPLDAYEERTAFRGVVATYDDARYQFDLLVDP